MILWSLHPKTNYRQSRFTWYKPGCDDESVATNYAVDGKT